MSTLRLMGLVILAGLTIGLFGLIYPHIQGMSAEKRAKQTADKLHSNIEEVLITGSPETVDIEVPGGYNLSFKENQIQMNNIKLPKEGYPIPIRGPELKSGDYKLGTSLQDNKILIEVIS